MTHFIVIREQGTAWNPSRSIVDQGQWTEHASFMNSLLDQGFVLLGGPVWGESMFKARLIVKAENEAEIHNRLAEDPWDHARLLQTLSIEPWEVILSK